METTHTPETIEKGGIEGLKGYYEKNKKTIKSRLDDFTRMKNSPDETIFAELVFCLFTPQSSARKCDRAVRCLLEKDLILEGTPENISENICGVRFHHTKSRRVVEARQLFLNTDNNKSDKEKNKDRITIKSKLESFRDSKEAREWLVANVKGIGYKEAGHFLRNIGMGFDLAILDRHILKNLVRYGAIDEMPKTLSKKKYLEIEEKMRDFSKKTGIPMPELDLLFWSMQTGEVFK